MIVLTALIFNLQPVFLIFSFCLLAKVSSHGLINIKETYVYVICYMLCITVSGC